MAQLVANTYADALLQLAVEEKKLERYETKAKGLVAAFDENREFRTVIEHPEITRAEKLRILLSAAGDDKSDSFGGLFNIVLNKNREKDLYGILCTFLDKAEKHRGVLHATVVSATELDEGRIKAIQRKLSENLSKEIIIDAVTDPKLIAGLKITVDGHVIDGTVRKEIDELRNALYQGMAYGNA